MASFYTIVWSDFVKEFLPPDKRKEVSEAYITALLEPLQTVHNNTFLVFKPFIEDLAKQTGQRILFESVLNETFNVVGPPFIYIDNSGDDVKPLILFNEAEGLEGTYLYNESEGQPPLYMNNESEITNNKNFIVYVPLAVYTSVGEEAIINEVERLRPASTFYTIQTY